MEQFFWIAVCLLGSGATADPRDWDICSLSDAVRVQAEYATSPDGVVFVLAGKQEARIAREWVECRQWSYHADAGFRLEQYVVADQNQTVCYNPSDRLANVWDGFSRIGSAFYGSNFTPYDAVRTLLTADRSGLKIEEIPGAGWTSYRFTPTDQDPEESYRSMRIDREGRVLLVEDWATQHDDEPRTVTRFSDYRELSDGSWFPTTIQQTVSGAAPAHIKWSFSGVAVVPSRPPPATPDFPEGTVYFDPYRGIEVDRAGRPVGTRDVRRESPGSTRRRIDATTVFAVIGTAFLVAAAWVYRRQSAS